MSMKSFVACVVALALALCSFPPSAHADDGARVTSEVLLGLGGEILGGAATTMLSLGLTFGAGGGNGGDMGASIWVPFTIGGLIALSPSVYGGGQAGGGEGDYEGALVGELFGLFALVPLVPLAIVICEGLEANDWVTLFTGVVTALTVPLIFSVAGYEMSQSS